MEIEMFNTLFGPLVFAMSVGTWGFFNRPEKRPALLQALVLMFVVGAVVFTYYPSSALFQLMALDGFVVTVLYALYLRSSVTSQKA